MQNNEAEAPSPCPEPFARCRICTREVSRTEQVMVWPGGELVAHLDCYDAHWYQQELAERVAVVGGAA